MTPAVMKAAGVEETLHSWHWLAAVGSGEFSEALKAWRQLRILGHIIRARKCPWYNEHDLTSVHLGFHCSTWASQCFWNGTVACEFSDYVDEEKMFIVKLRMMDELLPRMDAERATHTTLACCRTDCCVLAWCVVY